MYMLIGSCVCWVLRLLVVSARVEINRVYIYGHPVADDDGGVIRRGAYLPVCSSFDLRGSVGRGPSFYACKLVCVVLCMSTKVSTVHVRM